MSFFGRTIDLNLACKRPPSAEQRLAKLEKQYQELLKYMDQVQTYETSLAAEVARLQTALTKISDAVAAMQATLPPEDAQALADGLASVKAQADAAEALAVSLTPQPAPAQ